MPRYIMEIECGAGTTILGGEWEDVPEADRLIITKQNGLPCDGGGVPGRWCLRCHYVKVEEETLDV